MMVRLLKIRYLVGIILVVFFVTLIFIYYKKNVNEVDNSIPVTAVLVNKSILPLTVESYGSVLANQGADVNTQKSGMVTQILFQDGQLVKKGAPLFQLDSSEDQANLAAAEADLALKQSTLLKDRELFRQHYISVLDFETIQSQVNNLTAQVASLQNIVNQKQILAPFDGVVAEHQVNVGNFVDTEKTLVRIYNTHDLKLSYFLPEQWSSRASVGQSVTVTAPSQGEQSFLGKVTFVSPNIDLDSRMLSIEASINQESNVLKPGMFIHVIQIIDPTRQALLLPAQAVQIDLNGQYVYKVVNNKAVYTPVIASILTNNEESKQLNQHQQDKEPVESKSMIEIQQGIVEGDYIIVSGLQNVENGTAVKIINSRN